MEQRIFHGNLTTNDLGEALIARFNRGNLRAQKFGDQNRLIVQISSRPGPTSGGDTALSVILQKAEDGVIVRMGQQAWLGIAASLGETALAALRSPFYLIGRLDDLAQDIQNLQIDEQVWQAIEEVAHSAGASQQLSERLRRVSCPYCLTANPVGEASCIACGAPLGEVQPGTCPHCGFVLKNSEMICPSCKRNIPL